MAPAPLLTLNLAELLAQLAALPPDQRAALAVLLGTSPVAAATPMTLPASALDDRCPLDREKGKGLPSDSKVTR